MELLNSRLMSLDSFEITKGYQPLNSFFYVIKGSFWLTVDREKRLISENDLVFFPSDMEFERCMVSPIAFYNVNLQPSDREHLPRGYVRVENHLRLLSSLEQMTALCSQPDGEQELKNHFLRDIIIQLKIEGRSEKEERNTYVTRAIEYFEKNLTKKISVEDISTEVNMSVSGIIQHFKTSTGMTPIKYLISMRIKRAEELLCGTKMTLAQIASECGYENAFYLSKAFKKVKGVSPKAYRQKYGI